jgi:hypothetical protein
LFITITKDTTRQSTLQVGNAYTDKHILTLQWNQQLATLVKEGHATRSITTGKDPQEAVSRPIDACRPVESDRRQLLSIAGIAAEGSEV